jgi:hypothetical protein
MAGRYEGSYSKPPSDIFDLKGKSTDGIEAKNYISTLVQASTPEQKFAWIDRDENERTFMLMNQIRRAIELFLGDGTTFSDDSFEVVQIEDSNRRDNNFLVTAPNANNMENAGRYYISGLPATLLNEAELIPPPDNLTKIDNAKKIAPRISRIESSSSSSKDNVLVDRSADFQNVVGNELIPNLDNPDVRYEIISGATGGNRLEVDVNSKDELSEVTSRHNNYRIVPSTPSSDRTDRAYLDLYLDEVGPEEDSTIYHEIQQDSNTDQNKMIEGQRRVKLAQRVVIREDVTDSNNLELTDYEDSEGNQHLVQEIARFDRESGVSEIEDSDISDRRNIIRKLSNVGFVNLITNSSFELWENDNNPIDWEVTAPDNSTATISREDTNVLNGSYSAELNPDSFGSESKVRLTQVIGDEPAEEDIEDSFANREITFNLSVFSSVSDSARIFIRYEKGNSSDIEYSPYHSGDGNFENLSVTFSIPSGIDVIEFGMEVTTNDVAYADRAIAVYGEFTESIDYVNNILLNEVSLIRNEVQEARSSSVYGGHDNLDARIESAEDEIYEARESDIWGRFNRLDDRIDNYEDTFFTEHTIDGEHNPALRTDQYHTVVKWSRTDDNSISNTTTDRVVNLFSSKVEASDLIISSTQTQNSENFEDQDPVFDQCTDTTFFGMRLTSWINNGSGRFTSRLVDEWGHEWLSMEILGSNSSNVKRTVCTGQEDHPAFDEIGEIDPSDEFEMTWEIDIESKDSSADLYSFLQAEKTIPGIMRIS